LRKPQYHELYTSKYEHEHDPNGPIAFTSYDPGFSGCRVATSSRFKEQRGLDADGRIGHIPDKAVLADGQQAESSNDASQARQFSAPGRPQTPYRVISLGLVMFAVAVAILAILDLASPGQRWSMLDLQVYRWGGLLARHSGDLYGSEFPHQHLRFTYPPMAALTFAAMSAVSMSTLKWVVTVCSILSLTVTLWLTWGALGYRRSARRMGATLATVSVALWLQPVQQTLAFGQVNLILMLLIVADLCLPDAVRFKGVGVGLAAGFKLTPLIFIPYLLLTRRFRAACVALATFAVTIAGSLALLPADSRQFWIGGLFLDSNRTGNNAYVGNQSLKGTLARLLGSTAAAQPYWLGASAIIGVVGLLFAAWAARRGREMPGILLCALTGLLISPISWSHHWVWVAPALIVTADMAAGMHVRPGWRRWTCWFGVVMLAVPFFALPQSLVAGAVVQGTGAHGTQLLAENLYVIVGLSGLSIAGLVLIVHKRQRTHLSGADRPQVKSVEET
jgi:alpha-1,2-mannosyltransferase